MEGPTSIRLSPIDRENAEIILKRGLGGTVADAIRVGLAMTAHELMRCSSCAHELEAAPQPIRQARGG